MEELKYKYYFDKDYDPEYITGAFGGVLPGGELVLNFYLERMPIPKESKEVFSEDETESEFVVTDPEEFKVRRVVKSGIIMSPDTAKSVCAWIKEQLIDMGDDVDDL